MENPAVTLQSLLREMTDPATLARWPDPAYRCLQVSSYDRRTVAPDQPGWFANDDFSHYLRTETHRGRTEHVLLDADGPGCLVRFWLTAGGRKDGVLRVYLDHQTEPTLRFDGFDLLRGGLEVPASLLHPHPGYSPTGGGTNCYLPVPYARHARVTWEEKSEGQRYYHINYRTYAPGTSVETFSPAILEAARPLLAETNRALENPPTPTGREMKRSKKSGTLAAGAGRTLSLPAGPAAVRQVELTVRTENPNDPEQERRLRSVIVHIAFDGHTTVWCPATDFFGSGVGVNELRSGYRTVKPDGTMLCRWVMPYLRTARLTVQNLGDKPVAMDLRVTVGPWDWDKRSLYFHTDWRYEAGLETPPLRDWHVTRLTGRGVYVGDTLALFNPVPTWYGEGDEKIFVDGEAFPSHMGTGTEDYYGYSYAPKGIIQTPFANQVRVDEPRTQGWNVLTRTRPLDAIPFRKSLTFDLELISWKPTTLIYSATTHWYGAPGATCAFRPEWKDATRPVPTLADAQRRGRIPGAFEAETVTLTRKSGDFEAGPQDMDPWSRERWSGGAQCTVKAARVGDYVEFDVPAPDLASRKITLYLTHAPDYGNLAFTVNGTRSAAAFDGYAETVRPADPLPLGVFAPVEGRFRIRVTVTGAHPRASGARYYFGVDCVVLG